ncbi:hypothetical protein GCM10023195_17810 [Actinoallomurus liliacearum]|uniref:Peptidase C51 domain-containing protein n=1 Tax=Actinoallomurus liliacearum TaxID=1080073 RepID=A0ABP8TH77_9ACTN
MSAAPRLERSGARITAALSGIASAGLAAFIFAAGPAEASSLPAQAGRAPAGAPSTQGNQVTQVSGRGLDADPRGSDKGRRQVPTAAEALKVALSQVGTTEDAAGGSKFNQWFMASSYAKLGVARDGGSISDYADASWCDMFVTWVGAQAGVKGLGGDAFTPAHAQWFHDQGRWGSAPKPGAVVFFSWNGGKDIDSIDHVGLVIKDNGDGTIQTVEGNTDDAVKVRTRSKDSVVGYGYPEYGQ